LDSNVATVAITVNPVNDPPVAADDAYSVDEDEVLTVAVPGVLANDTDPEGDPLTAVLVSDVSKGTLVLSSTGSFEYTPDPDFNGADSFTYKANDGAADSNIATVTITVNPVNDAPVAGDDAYSVDEDEVLTVAVPGVLGNDTDPDGDALTAILVSGPSNGTLTLNADGSFVYTPDADSSGTDGFTYKANDGAADSNIATVTITVNPVNDAPVAVDDAYAAAQNATLPVAAPGVLANDTDPDGDALTAILVSGASNGTLTLNADGSLVYTPDADFNGTDSFTYKANDGALDSNVATVTISVEADAAPPEILNLKATPDVLKPNHKMIAVTLSCTLVDACDPNPTWCITSVSSNEPESGLGNWDRSPDWQIVGDHVVLLRGERSPKGTGRIYTITVEAADASGNCSMAMTQVRVPKGRKK